MKKIIISLLLMLTSVVSYAQKWEKYILEDEFYGTTKEKLYYIQDNMVIAYWSEASEVLFVFNHYNRYKSIDITTEAIINNKGFVHEDRKTAGYINKSGEIQIQTSMLTYPKAEDVDADYCTIFTADVTKDEMMKGKFIAVKYKDFLIDEEVVKRISLSGFTAAYNSKGKRP